MNNLAEQKRVFNAVFGVLAFWLLFVILFFALFFSGLCPDVALFGYRGVNYVGEDQSGVIETGDLVFCKDFHAIDNPLVEGQPAAFYVYTRNSIGEITGKELYIKVIDNSYVNTDHDLICIYFYDLDGKDLQYAEVPAQNIIGTAVYGLPYVGYAGAALTATALSGWVFFAILAVVLILLPIFWLMRRVEIYKRISPFREGLNTEKFRPETMFIYSKIREFLESGNMTILKGFDCDKVYVFGRQFCKIRYYDHALYVLINRRFLRADDRIERAGYIRIQHASEVPYAKERIYSMYKKYFKKKKNAKGQHGVLYFRGMPPIYY